MADPEEARVALQALFGAGRPRSPQSAAPAVSTDGESASQRAGVALRQLFKGDIQKALHSPAAASRMKEIEGRCSKLLEQVSSSGVGKFKPPPRMRPSRPKSGIDVGTATVAYSPAVKIEDIEVPVKPEVVPDPDEGKPRHRCCVIQDKTETGDALRAAVKDARRRLFTLDAETTRLTREVKMNRMKIWELQRTGSLKEAEIGRAIAPGNPAKSDVLAEEVSKVLEARHEAKKWLMQARRMDAELQQQFRGGGEAQKILLRHPAGEVFLPPMGSADDSDDGSESDYRPSPSAAARQRGGGEVQLASSDDEEELSRGGGGRPLGGGDQKAPPPPPSQQWRQVTNEDDDNYGSDASSMTSPSSKSGGGPSPTADAAPQNRLAAQPAVQRARSTSSNSSRSSSDADEADAKKKQPPQGSQPGATAAAVPPLPELSGLGNSAPAPAAPKAAAAKAAADDHVEEVSSEEIYSQDAEDDDDSSRSV